MKTKIILILLCLAFLNTAVHFIPFERNALAPDDYVLMLWTKSSPSFTFLQSFKKFPDRPLNYPMYCLQAKFVNDHAKAGLVFVFISSMLILFSVFFLLKELFVDTFLAYLGAALYCLLPNKLEDYFAPVYSQNVIFMSMYVLSFLFFIWFIKRRKTIYFILSFFAYTLGIFSYETGYFLPVIMLLYLYLFKKRNYLKFLAFYILPAVVYASYRLTNVFGLVSHEAMNRQISLASIPLNLTELFHHYLGRYMTRSVLYGIYKFFSIENPWLLLLIISNLIFLWIFSSACKKSKTIKIDIRLILLASAMFFAFIAPVMLNRKGGIGGRHLELPSIAISIVLLYCLSKAREYWRAVFLFLVLILSIICQGNTWSQVIACRLNGSLYATLQERKELMLKAANIVIDTKSFAERIPFTWINRDFNVLNTYYGAQAFEDRGLISMVKLITGDSNKPVYIAKESPKLGNDGALEIQTSNVVGYRKINKESVILPVQETLIIGFNDVYNNGFHNGLRRRQ